MAHHPVWLVKSAEDVVLLPFIIQRVQWLFSLTSRMSLNITTIFPHEKINGNAGISQAVGNTCITNWIELQNSVRTVPLHPSELTQQWASPAEIDRVIQAGYEWGKNGKQVLLHTSNYWCIRKNISRQFEESWCIRKP